MSDDWEEDSAPTSGFNGLGGGGGGGRGFGRPTSVGVGRGKFGGGFESSTPAENGTDGWNENSEVSSGFGGSRGGFGGGGRGGGGFGGGGGGGGGGFGGGGRGGGGFKGGRGGFGGDNGDDGDDGERRGFGRRGRGGRGGGFGRRDGDEDGDGESGGFGRRGRGGFSGRGRGGFGSGGDEEGEGGRRGGGGFGRRGGRGFGGRGGGDGDGDDEDGGGRRGGFGRGRGRRSFGGGSEDGGEEGEGGGGGRGFGRQSSRDGDESGQQEGERRRELYVPPPPSESEEEMFSTIATGINFDKYDDIQAEVTGSNAPPGISSFDECGFFETTRKNIERCKYIKPTPVQKHSIPIVLAGRDLMACAQTGSGKTAAFLLPTITRLIKEECPGASQNDTQSPEVLIVSPTRELTFQIYNEARKFVHGSVYRPVVVYGGTSVGHQLAQVERGCNIIVGTPGRLLDFLRRGKILLNNIKTLILDEADRMLDMGFEPEMKKIVSEFNMPPVGERQTLMFSATFPEDIQKLANEFLHNYLFLTIGVVGGTTTDIDQSVVEVGEYEKKEKLQEILTNAGADRTLVFVETKRNADYLASLLSQEEFPTTSIHGDRLQREREEALRDFRSGRSRVLVATSVAARGLDIPQVKHVINYDLPNSIEDYVHRIGRTGRIGNKGQATAFFQRDRDLPLARGLVKVLSDAHQDVPDFLEQAAEEAVGSDYGPAGGKFASKDLRLKKGRGGGDGFGSDPSGFRSADNGFGGGPGGGGFGGTSTIEEEEEW